MPSDEELRKVAEDVRALARSLARDFWEASQSARRAGRPPGDAFRHGVRDAAYGARKEFQRNMRHHWYGGGSGPWWGRGGHWSGWGPVPPGGYGPPGPPGPPGRGPGAGPPGQGPGAGAGPGPGQAGGDPNQPGYPGRPGAANRPGGWGPGPPAYPWARYGGGSHGRPYPARRRRGPLPPVRRRWDASILAALLVVVFGTAWLVGGLGLVHLSVEAVLAVGLMLLGAALVVTGRTDWSLSRHAWPVVLGLLLVVGLFATSTTFGVDGALAHFTTGTTNSAPTHGQTVYGGVGQLNLDLAKVPAGSTVKVETIAGETFITPPPSGGVVVRARILAGQICVPGQGSVGGIGASVGPTTLNPSPGTQPVTVEVHQLAGQIAVGVRGCHTR